MCRALLLLLLVCCAGECQAALVATIGTSDSNLPSTGGVVTMTVSIAGDAAEQLDAYDFYWDISNADLNAGGSPVTLSNFQAIQSHFQFDPRLPGGSGRDFGASGAFIPAASTTGGIDLFRFNATFDANGTANPQVYDFNFTPNALGFALRVNNTVIDNNTVTYNNTTVTVAAVPEPTALAALGMLGGCLLFRRKRA